MNKVKLRQMLKSFLIEDIGDRDITSETIFPPDQIGKGMFTVKEDGMIAGLSIIQEVYQLLDSRVNIRLMKEDGDKVGTGETVAEVEGPIIPLLSGERIILNIIQRMSGIASLTNKCIRKLNDSSISLCDTRKTTPGLNMLEKYAVRVGGGRNHRYGLYDGVLIKDNHIAFCGSITKAVETVRKQTGHMVKIEVETESSDQVMEAVHAGADIIMLDNRPAEEVKQLTALIPESIITEASGGITLKNIHEYSGTGVDYISLGFLTHSVEALDISLNVQPI